MSTKIGKKVMLKRTLLTVFAYYLEFYRSPSITGFKNNDSSDEFMDALKDGIKQGYLKIFDEVDGDNLIVTDEGLKFLKNWENKDKDTYADEFEKIKNIYFPFLKANKE